MKGMEALDVHALYISMGLWDEGIGRGHERKLIVCVCLQTYMLHFYYVVP